MNKPLILLAMLGLTSSLLFVLPRFVYEKEIHKLTMLKKYTHLLVLFIALVWIFSVFGTILLKANLVSVVTSDFLNYYVGAVLVDEGRGDLLYNANENFLVQDEVLGASTLRNINTL